jgi:hypothetical protein
MLRNFDMARLRMLASHVRTGIGACKTAEAVVVGANHPIFFSASRQLSALRRARLRCT